MKTIPLLVVAAALLLSAPLLAGPAEYFYDTTPFGKTAEEVLPDFSDARVHEEKTPFIEAVGDYALDHYFEGGLTRDQNKGTCFLPNVVTKYVVENPGWDGVVSVMLYFEGFSDGKVPRRLFMVKKVFEQPPAAGDFVRIFEVLSARITKGAGHEPVVHQGRLQSFSEQVHAYYLPALVGVWDQGEVLAFLMVANSPEGPKPPQVLLISKDGLARYLENCKVMSD